MSSQTHPVESETRTHPAPAPKVDMVSAPTLAMLAACVLAAFGNSRGSALLLWQLPLTMIGLSVVYVAFRAFQARRRAATS